MKKRFFSLLAAITLLAPLCAMPAQAAGEVPPWTVADYPKSVTEVEALIEAVANGVKTIDRAVTIEVGRLLRNAVANGEITEEQKDVLLHTLTKLLYLSEYKAAEESALKMFPPKEGNLKSGFSQRESFLKAFERAFGDFVSWLDKFSRGGEVCLGVLVVPSDILEHILKYFRELISGETPATEQMSLRSTATTDESTTMVLEVEGGILVICHKGADTTAYYMAGGESMYTTSIPTAETAGMEQDIHSNGDVLY